MIIYLFHFQKEDREILIGWIEKTLIDIDPYTPNIQHMFKVDPASVQEEIHDEMTEMATVGYHDLFIILFITLKEKKLIRVVYSAELF